MSEFLEMVEDGILCEGCGSYIGGDSGYPIRCRDCKPKPKKDKQKNK